MTTPADRHTLNYCEPPDIPEGMTIAEYRTARRFVRKPRLGVKWGATPTPNPDPIKKG